MPEDAARRGLVSRVLLSTLFVGAGILHFVNPAPFVQIVPPALPLPLALVYLSGLCEIMGGVGVCFARLRRPAGYGLIALLIAVFPANITMFQQQLAHGWTPYTWLLLLRLPVQVLLILWVYRATLR